VASELMRAFAELIRDTRDSEPADLSIAARREGMEAVQSGWPIPDDVSCTDFTINGTPARWVATADARADRALLFLHGGGYVMGSLNTHRELMARLSRSTGARVLGIDYRLAPEHPFPAALDDAEAAYRWLLGEGFAAHNLLLAGDSAGGGLSMATLLRLRDLGVALPAGAVLFSPWADLTGSGDSIRTRAAAEPMVTPQGVIETAMQYCASSDPRHPLVSPVFANLTGLPPLLIQVGDDEILLDDSTRLAANAKRDGVSAELQIWEGAFHVFQALPSLPEAAEALAKVATFARARFTC